MQHRLVSDQLTVLINNLGAEVFSIKNKNGLEYIWQGDKAIWGRHAPVLFPIVGKLKNNSFIFEGKTYELSQHGFARDMDFTMHEKTETSCTLVLKSSTETKNKYPFEFSLYIHYELKGNELATAYKIINPSEKPLLFSIGAHPGFNCPLLEGERFEDYYLEFEKSNFSQTTLLDGLRLNHRELDVKDNRLALSLELFAQDALVFENSQVNQVSLCSTKSSHKIKMACTNWPYFGIWSKKDSAAFICLEPWYGIADHADSNQHLKQKEGIIELLPSQEFDCHFSISID